MKTKSKGIITQDENGLWKIDTKIKINGEWKHFKRTGFKTKSDAQSAYETERTVFIKKREEGKGSVVLFDDLIKEYSRMRKIVVGATTTDCDKSIFNVYMLPYFGGKMIKDCLNEGAIFDWYHNIVDSTRYSDNKKSKVITRMKDLLKFAYMHKYINAVVYQDCDVNLYQVKVNKAPKAERVIWSSEEEKLFWDQASKDKKDYLMFRLFFHCSPRLGEFLGLQPKCFDSKNRKITIKQQAYYISGKGLIVTDKLKTHESYRTIIISKEISEELEEYIKVLNIKDDEFLFFDSKKDMPMCRTTFRRKLKKYCKLAGIREVNPHAARHMQAVKLSRTAKNGAEIEVCARRLGHSPEMFMNTYAKHTNDDTELGLLERMAEA